MSEKNRWLLGGFWLIASLSALLIPVFVPSYPYGFLPNVMEVATSTMFILSFPCSLFALPFLLAADNILGVDPISISGMYTHLSMLFVIGAVQWFWIVPRIWFKQPVIESLKESIEQLEPAKEVEFHRYSSRERTPVERILDEDRG